MRGMKGEVVGSWMLCILCTLMLEAAEGSGLRNAILSQVQAVSCNDDEYSMQFAVQRGCRKMGDDTTSVCCGSCDRAVCKEVACIACKVDVNDIHEYIDQVSFNRATDGPHGSYVLPITDPIAVLHAYLELGISFIPAGQVLGFFVSVLWPQFQGGTWDEVKEQVKEVVQEAFIGQVELKLFGDPKSPLPMSGAGFFISEFEKRTEMLEANFENAFGELSGAISSLTADEGGIDATAGFPLAVIASTMMFNFLRAAIDRFNQLQMEDLALIAKERLENFILEYVPRLTKFAFNEYRNWYIDNQLYHNQKREFHDATTRVVEETYAWKDGKIDFTVARETRSPSATKDYLRTMMTNHIHRLIAPLYLVPSIVDKALPPVPPMFSEFLLGGCFNGPFHPWMTSNKGDCCTKLNKWTTLIDFDANVGNDIDGLLINGILAGDMGKGGYHYRLDGSVLSVYIRATDDKIVGLTFHTENGQTFVSASNEENQLVVVQSPLSGLSVDRWVITGVQTEEPSARFLSFRFLWKGDKPSISDWNYLPNYGKPFHDSFGDFLKEIYIYAGFKLD